jgi:thymidylate synthase
MRIYKNLYEAAKETQRNLHEMGIEVELKSMQNHIITAEEKEKFTTKEIMGESFCIKEPWKGVDEAYELIYGEDAQRMKQWAEAELHERISNPANSNPGEAWKIREDIWAPMLNAEGKFDYSYPERLHKDNAFNRLIEQLKEDPNSRRCVLTIYETSTDLQGVETVKRVPCSLNYSWLYRNGKLNMFYNMRSCDFYNHFVNDLWLAGEINDYVALNAGFNIGYLYVNIMSLHAYKGYMNTKNIF